MNFISIIRLLLLGFCLLCSSVRFGFCFDRPPDWSHSTDNRNRIRLVYISRCTLPVDGSGTSLYNTNMQVLVSLYRYPVVPVKLVIRQFISSSFLWGTSVSSPCFPHYGGVSRKNRNHVEKQLGFASTVWISFTHRQLTTSRNLDFCHRSV